MKSIKSQDYYEILGVSRRASQDDIRRAFKLCKHTYQDDSLATYSLFSEEEKNNLFSFMSQAYEILHDPGSRQEYDNYLSQKEGKDNAGHEGERMVASMIGIGAESRQEPTSSPQQARGTGLHTVTTQRNPPARSPAPAASGADSDAKTPEDLIRQSTDAITGAVLKKLRTTMGISLEEMSDRTKIRQTYLRYIEDEEYEFLPAPVYIKGFVSNIATVLGLPPKRAAEEYLVEFKSHSNAKK